MTLILILAAIFLVGGFVAGATLGALLTNAVRAVEKRVKASIVDTYLAAKRDVYAAESRAEVSRAKLEQDVEEKRAALEQTAKDSFSVFQADVEAIVRRLEALEHNQAMKIAEVISPNAPRA